jgi:hypothetical protein
MRDMNLTYLIFKNQFRQQLNRKLSKCGTENIEILRDAVIDNPTFLRDFEIVLPRKFHQIRGLCLIWDSLPEILRFEIYLQLEERISSFEFKKQLELKSLIEPEIREKFLYLTERYSSHQIFGNLIFDAIESLKFVKIKRKSTKVKKPQRKRGYDDKGTLRSFDIWSHRWKPSFDWSLTELQNKQERTRSLQEKYLNKFVNFLRSKQTT